MADQPQDSGPQIINGRVVTPGFGGAILDLIRALMGGHRETPPMGAINPANREAMTAAGLRSDAPQSTDLGNQF